MSKSTIINTILHIFGTKLYRRFAKWSTPFILSSKKKPFTSMKSCTRICLKIIMQILMKSIGISQIIDILSINAMLKNNTMNSLITSIFTRDTEYFFMGILTNKNSLRNNQSQSQILSKGFIDTMRKITFKRVWKFEEMSTSRWTI